MKPKKKIRVSVLTDDDMIDFLLSGSLRTLLRNIESFLTGESIALSLIYKHKDEEYHPSDLAEELEVSFPRVTSIIDGLREKKYVKKEKVPSAGRSYLLKITDEGIVEAEKNLKCLKKHFSGAKKEFGEENIQKFFVYLMKAAAKSK
ncbi:MAG: MarR family winged helix-turn-helix transcriptional regulator [Bacilli bacterium]|nr:MarR family winged helix-turn-helix transcriptional regulator [Bacilli bacterium]